MKLWNTYFLKLKDIKESERKRVKELDKSDKDQLKKFEKKLKLSKFGTFSIRQKKSRIGRNPKTKEEKMISSREVILFKPSKDFKNYINQINNE